MLESADLFNVCTGRMGLLVVFWFSFLLLRHTERHQDIKGQGNCSQVVLGWDPAVVGGWLWAGSGGVLVA